MLSEKCIGVVVRGARSFCEGDMAALSIRQPIMETRPARTRTVTTLDTVRRNLFGCSDSEENRRFLKRELALQLELDSQRWGFDFAKGVPLPGPQDFSWQMVAAQSVPVTLRMQPVPKPNPQQEPKAPSPDANKTQKRITGNRSFIFKLVTS